MFVIAAGLLVLGGVVFYLTLPDVAQLAHQPPVSTAFVDLRREEAEDQGRAFNLRWQWVPLRRISPYLRHAVVWSEDAHFFKHDGVDWKAIKTVAERSWEKRALGRGASTITQQLAKNLFLSPSRNPLRKVREFLLTRRLEDKLSKQRILELYLNVAEWGDGVFGAEAAAQYWFHKSAARLTPAEAARLAVALPNPHLRSPKVRSRKLKRKAAQLVRAMRWSKLCDQASCGAP